MDTEFGKLRFDVNKGVPLILLIFIRVSLEISPDVQSRQLNIFLLSRLAMFCILSTTQILLYILYGILLAIFHNQLVLKTSI